MNEVPEKEAIGGVMESQFIDLYSRMKAQTDSTSEEPSENHQPFTTFKYRTETGYVKRTIDYMFLSNNKASQKVSVKEYIDNADFEKHMDYELATPCENWPSDHYSLAYKV